MTVRAWGCDHSAGMVAERRRTPEDDNGADVAALDRLLPSSMPYREPLGA